MPLIPGKSKKVRNTNIDEMLKKYKKTGTIGKTHPRSMAHAQKIASAAAYRKQRGY